MSTGDFLLGLARSSLAAGVLVLVVLATQRVFRRQLPPRWHCAPVQRQASVPWFDTQLASARAVWLLA